MKLGVYNEINRLNKTYVHTGQILLNQSAKLINVFPFKIANFLYPTTVILPACSFLLSHIYLTLLYASLFPSLLCQFCQILYH